MRYDHTLLVMAANVDLNAADFREEMARAIRDVYRDAENAVFAHDGGGWEIISHDITVAGSSVIGSFIFRKPVES